MRLRSASASLNAPPSHSGRHVTITGDFRPARAAVTSGSATESRRSSTTSAPAADAASRRRRSSAVVGAEATMTRSGLDIKKASSTVRLKRLCWLRISSVSGQGSRPFSLGVIPPSKTKRASPRRDGCRAESAFGRGHMKRRRYKQAFEIVKRCATIRKRFPNRFNDMKRLLFALFTSLALLVVSLPAAPPYYPIDQVQPGMVATVHTVWQGDTIEEFKVHIIGVLRNVIGPRRDLILAKLEGGPLAHTGVIAGMSGSPVYIDGKLVGAVSYSLGAFSKEPIAGITPIAEMIDAATLDTPRPPIGTRARLELPVTRESVAAAMRASMSWARPFADRPGDVQIFGDGVTSQVATMLRPIATPLNLGGFSPDVAEMLGASFRDCGFMPIAGAPAAGQKPSQIQQVMPGDMPLRPGSA